MLNFIWAGMIVIGVIVGIATGRVDALSTAMLNSAKESAAMVLSLLGIYMFWMGILNIAKEAGLVQKLAKKWNVCWARFFRRCPPAAVQADIFPSTSLPICWGWAMQPRLLGFLQ